MEKKLARDLKLGDNMYYVDTAANELAVYVIRSLELVEASVDTPLIIRIGLFNWEKTPTVLADSTGGSNKYAGFPIYTNIADAEDYLHDDLSFKITHAENQLRNLKEKQAATLKEESL